METGGDKLNQSHRKSLKTHTHTHTHEETCSISSPDEETAERRGRRAGVSWEMAVVQS